LRTNFELQKFIDLGKTSNMILEACVENHGEAVKAESLGAHRVELCDNLSIGGTTPSFGTISVTQERLTIPIMVLIRPRGGDFVYSKDEISIMKQDIKVCKELGVQGVVLGALTNEGTVDMDIMSELLLIARPMSITFNKAIDETPNIMIEFGKLLDLGVDRILTSGGKDTALEGANVINEMIQIANGKVKVLAAGKITADNLSEHQKRLNTNEFHGQMIVGDLED